MAHMAEKMEAMHAEKEAAVEAARRAIGALDTAKGDAAKATGNTERHQQVCGWWAVDPPQKGGKGEESAVKWWDVRIIGQASQWHLGHSYSWS